jgi:hypothetical protein
MNYLNLSLVVICFIGSLNWFVTAIRNMSENEETYDIFNNWLDQKFVNWIYIFVFISSLLLLVLTLFPNIL